MSALSHRFQSKLKHVTPVRLIDISCGAAFLLKKMRLTKKPRISQFLPVRPSSWARRKNTRLPVLTSDDVAGVTGAGGVGGFRYVMHDNKRESGKCGFAGGGKFSKPSDS